MASISGSKHSKGKHRYQKLRVLAMLVFLVVAVAVGIFAYDQYSPYEVYPYEAYPYEGYPYEGYNGYDYSYIYDSYHDESNIGDAPNYYHDRYSNFVAVGDELIFFGDFEVYDYENNLMTFGDYIFYVCTETMSGSLLGSLGSGIWITFNPNGGLTPGGHGSRQANEEHASGDYVYIGVSNMPNPANSPLEGPNTQREWMGWNTQPDGRGEAFTGTTLICIEYGLGNAEDGPQFHVYAVWGWRVSFLGNPILLSALNPGTDPGNSYHFTSRLIPHGWTVNETANYPWLVTSVWPRDLNRPSFAVDRPGFDFVGWYDSASVVEGQVIGPNDPITRFTLVYAWWDSHAVPVVTFNPGAGAISSEVCTIHPGPPRSHSGTRNVRVGWNIFDSSTAAPGFLDINPNVAWSRSAPAAVRTGMTVEGWWTEINGWGGSGERWASPGGDRIGSGDPDGTFHVPTPADWALRTVYDDLEVHAHWVYRVSFHLNLGHVVADSQQPLGFYCHDFPRPASDHFHGGADTILFRDIPEGVPLDQRTVFQNGMQFNHIAGTALPRNYIPEGVTRDPSGGPDFVPSVIAIARTGHTFNGWWNYQIPPDMVVGGILRVLDPHNPSTLIGTIWENANLIQFTRYCEIPYSKTVYAHWYPNDEVIVTFDIRTQINAAGVRSEYDDAYWPFSWQWPPARNAPIPVGTNNQYQIALAGGATVQGTLQLSMPFFPSRPGYVFVGWHTRPHVMSDDLIRGSHFNAGTPVPMNNITVYAQWAPYITVIFDANGGTTISPGADNPAGGVIWSERIPPGANEEHVRFPYGLIRDVTPWGAPYNPATGQPTTPAGSVRERELSMGALRTNGYADAAHGARVQYHLVMATLASRHERPGFISLLTQWQWIGAGTTGTWRGGSPWNTAQDGTSEIFGENLPISVLMQAPEYDAINKEIRLFMQWGVPIDFIPISTLPLLPDTRRFAVPEGRTIANMFDAPRNRHLPNPDLTFPLVGGPPQAPVIPNAALIQNNNRGVTFSAAASMDMRFPVPNHSVASGLGNWDSIYTHTEVAGLGFRGWFTADGRQFFPNTPLPVLDLTTNDPMTPIPIRIYGHWGNVMTFMVGNHPAPALVDILPQNLTRPFSPGAVQFGDATPFHVDVPPAPNAPTGVGMPTFIAWFTSPARTDAYEGVRIIPNVTVLPRETDFNLYARWGLRIDLNVNAPDANFNHTPAFPVPYTVAEIGDRVHDLAGINCGTEIERANHWRLFGRWNTEPDGSGIFYTALAPTVTTSRTLYAQWEGQFSFNPMGGTMPGLAADTIQLVYVSEGFSITTNNHVTGPGTPQTVPTMPNNPTHPDPSMVFMGWRIPEGPLASTNILTRTQVSNIIMNGYLNPNDEDCVDRNAPTGRIILEAVWHQRLIFYKTGELLYPTGTNDRVREFHSGAIFELRRFNEATSNWDLVLGNISSGDGASIIGSATGDTPYTLAIAASPGLVVMTLPGTAALTAGSQYRLFETLPPLGYMRTGGHWNINMSAGNTDARILSITHVDHDMYFVDWNDYAETPRDYLINDWHVGNMRPRLMFTKLDRYNDPLDGVRFVVEQRTRANASDEWGDWEVVYEAQPSGTAIPVFPGQPTPSPTPTPDGVVVITRPFTPNAPSTTVQYRLREIAVPSSSGYLIPILGRWNIVTNRYSGVVSLAVCTEFSAAPNFVFINADVEDPNYPWDGSWSVDNTPSRYWPFIKTDQFFNTATEHSYLPGAVFRLYVYNGPGTPSDVLITTDMIIPTPSSPIPGTWSLVIERTSSGGPTPNPMWLPMMPGRHYQLVEITAPAGFQLPWGQWRITVTGATNAATIQGTGLSRNVISAGGATGTPPIEFIEDYFIFGSCTPNCFEDCDDDHSYYIDAFFIINRQDFDLPMTGGAGIMAVTSIGFALIGAGVVLLLLKKRGIWKSKPIVSGG